MTFREEYADLECKFQRQVECDNTELGTDRSYAHNFIPPGPVDYIFIAMEPSTGVPVAAPKGSSKKELWKECHRDRNFTWSVEDFILHYCIREYLCQKSETYHLTDLSKCGMKTKEAQKDRWYPILEEEIQLLTKPGKTQLIAIGKVVDDYLKGKHLSQPVYKVLHYAKTAASHRNTKIEPWRKHFPAFSETVDKDAFGGTIKEVLNDADMRCYVDVRPEGGKSYELTCSRKKLMFYYKNRFSEIRKD